MLLIHWLRRLSRGYIRAGLGRSRKQPFSLNSVALVERLEQRRLLTTWTVATNTDAPTSAFPGAAPLTLRQAVFNADHDGSGDTIVFSSTLKNETIMLTQGELPITGSMTITGLGASSLTVSGTSSNTASRIFDISSSTATVSISGLTMTQGAAPISSLNPSSGGAIYNAGNLTLANDTITKSSAANGGGIYNDVTGLLSTTSVTISKNFATGGTSDLGGGVYNSGNWTSTTDTISNNQAMGAATNEGAGIYNAATGVLSTTSDTISLNSATGGTSDFGGGIYNLGGWLSANDTLSNNSVSSTVSNSTDAGGAVDNSTGSSATLTNDVLIGNTSDGDGGGVANNGTLTTTDVTITTNASTLTPAVTTFGAGISNHGTWNSINTIVADDTGGNGDVYNVGKINAFTTLIGDNSSGLVDGTNGNIINPSNQVIFNPSGAPTLASNGAAVGNGGTLGYVTAVNGNNLTVSSATFIAKNDWLNVGGVLVQVASVNTTTNIVTLTAAATSIQPNASIILAYDQTGAKRLTNDIGARENILTGITSQVFNGVLTINDSNTATADTIRIYYSPADGSFHINTITPETQTAGANQAFPAQFLSQIVVNPNADPNAKIVLDTTAATFATLAKGVQLNTGAGVTDNYVFETTGSNRIGSVAVVNNATGTSVLNFSSATGPVTVNLGLQGTAFPQNVYGDPSQPHRLDLSLINVTDNQTVIGGQGANNLTAAPSGTDVLDGSASSGVNTFSFVNPTGTANVTVNPSTKTGATNTLDFHQLGTATTLNVNMQSAGKIATAGTLTVSTTLPQNFQTIKGGAGTNNFTASGTTAETFVGGTGTNNFTASGTAGVTFDASLSTASNTFSFVNPTLALPVNDTVTPSTKTGATNTLDFHQLGATMTLNVNMQTAGAIATAGVLTVSTASPQAFQTIVGGAGTNNFTASATASETFDGSPSTVSNTFSFVTPTGTANDTVNPSTKAGATNTLDFHQLGTTTTLNVNMQSAGKIATAGTLTVSTASPQNFQTIKGGAGTNNFTASGTAVETFVGGTGTNNFTASGTAGVTFDGSPSTASNTFSFVTPTGPVPVNDTVTPSTKTGATNTLDFHQLGATMTLNVNMQTAGAIATAGVLTVSTTSPQAFQTIVGGAGTNNFTASATASETFDGSPSTVSNTFSFVNPAGTANDIVNPSTKAGAMNTLDFHQLGTTTTLNVNMQSAGKIATAGTLTVSTTLPQNFQTIKGGAGTNNFTASGTTAETFVGGTGTNNFTASGTAGVTFDASLSTASNTFSFVNPTLALPVNDTVTPSTKTGATNTLDFHQLGSATTLNVNLRAGAQLAKATIGTATLNVTSTASPPNIQAVVGGTGSNFFIAGNGSVSFDGSLGKADTYSFFDPGSVGQTVTLNPGVVSDTLDFSNVQTSSVNANLLQGGTSLAKVTPTSGTHSLTIVTKAAGQQADFDNVYGGNGNDIILGNGRPNILRGNGGNDLIIGGSGDSIYGGNGNDVIYLNTDQSQTPNGPPPPVIPGLGGGTNTLVDTGAANNAKAGPLGDVVTAVGTFAGNLTIDTGSFAPPAASNEVETVQVVNATIGTTAAPGSLTISGVLNDANAANSILISGSTITGNLAVTLGDGVDYYTDNGDLIGGNDALSFGGGNDTIMTSVTTVNGNLQVTLGNGSNTFTDQSDVIGGSETILGNGNETISSTGSTIKGNRNITLGDGADTDTETNDKIVGNETLLFGNGNDAIKTTGTSITGNLSVTVGNGSIVNYTQQTDIVTGASTIKLGNGTDTLWIKGSTDGATTLIVGNGNDTVYVLQSTISGTISGTINDALDVTLGSGQDVYTQQLDHVYGSCSINGTGTDTVYVAGFVGDPNSPNRVMQNYIQGNLTVSIGPGTATENGEVVLDSLTVGGVTTLSSASAQNLLGINSQYCNFIGGLSATGFAS